MERGLPWLALGLGKAGQGMGCSGPPCCLSRTTQSEADLRVLRFPCTLFVEIEAQCSEPPAHMARAVLQVGQSLAQAQHLLHSPAGQ